MLLLSHHHNILLVYRFPFYNKQTRYRVMWYDFSAAIAAILSGFWDDMFYSRLQPPLKVIHSFSFSYPALLKYSFQQGFAPPGAIAMSQRGFRRNVKRTASDRVDQPTVTEIIKVILPDIFHNENNKKLKKM